MEHKERRRGLPTIGWFIILMTIDIYKGLIYFLIYFLLSFSPFLFSHLMSSIKSNTSYTSDIHNIDNIKIVHHPETVPIKLANNTSVPFHDYLAQTCPSLFGPKAHYSPTPYLRSKHLQTIYASFYDGSSTENDITYQR